MPDVPLNFQKTFPTSYEIIKKIKNKNSFVFYLILQWQTKLKPEPKNPSELALTWKQHSETRTKKSILAKDEF